MKRSRLYAIGIFVAAFGLLLAGARTEGITRDESYYFRAGESYSKFFIDLAHHVPIRQAVQNDFSYNAEHPALMKQLFGYS